MPSAGAWSLKRRLLFGLLGTVVLVWLATAVYTFFDAQHEIDELLDAHLAQSASLIVAQAGHELEELEHAPAADRRARRVVFQIWERGRVLRLHSAEAPQSRLSPREEGYSNASIAGRSWRVFSTWDARRRFLVQIAERDETRREIASGIAGNLLFPLLAALPVLALFIWVSIGRALQPLGRLGQQVERRKADELGALAAEAVPSEVVPLVRSLNALFERVGRLLENERRFTADAAHELRTPLAALKAQAQVARGAGDDAVRRHALDNVIAGCDRAARLVDQLLTLARLEPGHARQPAEPCELAGLARQAIAELAPASLARNVDIELRASGPAPMVGHPELIAVLMRNLVDNAVRYSSPGANVVVDVSQVPDAVRLAVTDEGPGVEPGERGKLGQRFFRILGTGQSGSGLGLSIVRRICEIHAAHLAFAEGNGGRGLRASVEFPFTSPPSEIAGTPYPQPA
jgi:two-component system sensor histidine kinase QseC